MANVFPHTCALVKYETVHIKKTESVAMRMRQKHQNSSYLYRGLKWSLNQCKQSWKKMPTIINFFFYSLKLLSGRDRESFIINFACPAKWNEIYLTTGSLFRKFNWTPSCIIYIFSEMWKMSNGTWVFVLLKSILHNHCWGSSDYGPFVYKLHNNAIWM